MSRFKNHVSIFEGVTIEDGVFIGPHVCFTNDMAPRAITPDGKLKSADDWEITPTLVKYGASIGAGSVIVCGVTIGEFALVGAGSVVTRDVAPHALVLGIQHVFKDTYAIVLVVSLRYVSRRDNWLVGVKRVGSCVGLRRCEDLKMTFAVN